MFNTTSKVRYQANIIKRTVFFDEEHYRSQARIDRKEDAALHYLKNWKKTGFRASAYFDEDFYTKIYPDVKLSNENPLFHYVTYGWKEGRVPTSAFDRSGFLAAHKYINPEKSDPAACCIMLYGGFRWEKPEPSAIPEEQRPYSDVSLYIDERCRPYFDEMFYTSMYPDVARSAADPFLHYMTIGFKENRDPSPSFDTFYYRNKYLGYSAIQNPLIHYASSAHQNKIPVKPETSFILPVIPNSRNGTLSICVHVHCHYIDHLGEVCRGLTNFPGNTHVVFTVSGEADAIFVRNYLNQINCELESDVLVAPNIGRDIAPFIVTAAEIWTKFDLVLHLHSKESPHVSWGKLWREYLFDQLMGSAEVVDAIVSQFDSDNKLGVLYPDNFHYVKQFTLTNTNTENVDRTLKFLGINTFQRPYCNFGAGSMCWFRTSSLRLLTERISQDLFEEEDGQVDGTLAHALERVMPIAAKFTGFEVRSYTTLIRRSLGQPYPVPSREQRTPEVTDVWPRDTPRAALLPPVLLAPPSRAYNSARLDIHWVVPSFAEGAGGHMTIFRIIKLLEEFGHRQTVWLQNAGNLGNEIDARHKIESWYSRIGRGVNVLFLPADLRQLSGDVLVATDCWTAFPVSRAARFKERFYFVQDYEPDFHPAGSNRLIAEATYHLGFSALCAGPWLLSQMKSKGLWARQWDLCADHEIYYPGASVTSENNQKTQIAFYARPYTPRRAVELGFAALERLHFSGRNFNVHLFGEEDIVVNYNFPYKQHGILSHDKLAELYRSLDIGMVFSATNYSLIPLEMMACGLPVVELDVDSTRAVFQDGEVAFAEPTPNGIALTIEKLMIDAAARNRQRKKGLEFTASRSWETSARKIETAIKSRLSELNFVDISQVVQAAPAIKSPESVSVVIPTYNAGPEFRDVLEATSSQRCGYKFDVLVIDSESNDDTCQIAEDFRKSGVRLLQIPKSEFQHGRTRNLGVAMTEGDYICFLTQDARPANDSWLSSLISGFEFGSNIAGVTGRHRAYPHHGSFIARDIQGHFDNLSLLPRVIDFELGLPSLYFRGGVSWRMLSYFYSDNNSAISRRVWNCLPYPEIDWGEDQVWASLALGVGFQKAYVDDAVVYHSHRFAEPRLLNTAIIEGRFWAEEFGIRLHVDEISSIAAMNERDRAYARENGISASELSRRLRENELLVRGRVQGWKDSAP